MNIVNADARLIPVNHTPEGMIAHIEKCGRTCYKSEPSSDPASGVAFARRLIAAQHEAMLEHGTIILKLGIRNEKWLWNVIEGMAVEGIQVYIHNTQGPAGVLYSGNIRAWRSTMHFSVSRGYVIPMAFADMMRKYAPLFDDVLGAEGFREMPQNIDRAGAELVDLNPADLNTTLEERVHHRMSVRFIVPRGVSHELVRHRPASFAQESTRYCNYSKEKFGTEITVIQPPFYLPGTDAYDYWTQAMTCAENTYFKLLDFGCSPQQARGVLPLDLKTEVIMTANVDEWIHFLNLRCKGTTGSPHPQMREVARMAANELARDSHTIYKWAEENL